MAKIKLTPITRLTMSMDHEMDIDSKGQFSVELYNRYLSTLLTAEKQRDGKFKGLLVADAIVALLLSGKSLKIPWTEVTTSELPAVREIVVSLASIGFLFAALSYVNALCYSLVVQQFSIRQARRSALDPDFLIAADNVLQFSLKIFRQKFNFWGADFYSPGWGFKLVSIAINSCIALLFTAFPVAHLSLVGLSLLETINSFGGEWWVVAFASVCVMFNLVGLAVLILSSVGFTFEILEPKKSDEELKGESNSVPMC
jgi:hypothetical protein